MTADRLLRGNLFTDTNPSTTLMVDGEAFSVLLQRQNVRIERIVSTQKIAKTTYIQDQDEWVILLKGNATLTVEEQNINLCAGDYVFLPSQIPHTVVSISQGAVWLAVHLYPEGTPIPNH